MECNKQIIQKDGLVSILVPVFNTELYLEKCLDSLISQTYKNIEIIVVDNASTDSSLRILKDYAKKDDRLSIIERKKTRSVGTSRNMALDAAKGEYIWFIDSDDYAEPNFLEVMLKKMKKADVDIVQCCYKTFDDFGNEEDLLPYKKDKIYSGRDLCILMNDFVGLCGPNVMLWNKLYKREALENIRFFEGRAYEDMFRTYIWLYSQEKILWIADRLMHWRKNIYSGTTKYNYRDFYLDEIVAYIQRLNFFKEHKDFQLYRLVLKRMYYVSAQQLYLYTKFITDKASVKKQSAWLKSILSYAYTELQKMDWPLYTKCRIRFIHHFPKTFGWISVHRKLDLSK